MNARAGFEGVVGDLEYPMFIATARAGEERLGCLVGFTTQASIDPPRFIVCLSHNNRTYRHGRDAPVLGVHAVPPTPPTSRSSSAARPATNGQVRPLHWHDGPEGVPILDRCENWFVGRVLERWDAGDHDAFLLEPVAADPASRGVHLPPRQTDRAGPRGLTRRSRAAGRAARCRRRASAGACQQVIGDHVQVAFGVAGGVGERGEPDVDRPRGATRRARP